MFLVVGLAAASLVLFIFFWLRRRRNKQRQRDASIAAGLAALAHNRTFLDDDDRPPPAGSLPDMAQQHADNLSLKSRREDLDFNPYSGYTYGTSRAYAGSLRPGQPYSPVSGYEETPTRDPDPLARGHTPELSFGSASINNLSAGPPTPTPAIVGAHQRTPSTTPLMTQVAPMADTDAPPSPGSHYSDTEGGHHIEKDGADLRKSGPPDPRLNAALLARSDSQGGASLGDHVDYTRPLTVRNE